MEKRFILLFTRLHLPPTRTARSVIWLSSVIATSSAVARPSAVRAACFGAVIRSDHQRAHRVILNSPASSAPAVSDPRSIGRRGPRLV